MKIEELADAPQWLRDAETIDANVEIVRGIVVWRGGTWWGGTWEGGTWRGGTWEDGTWEGGTWEGGTWRGGLVYGSSNFVQRIASVQGLYEYQVMAVLFTNGERWVRMGCLFKSLDKWERVGILASNTGEFPNDGSFKSKRRAAAFAWAKAMAEILDLK